MGDDSLPFIEVLGAHIRDWEEAAKVCEKNVHSVEMTSAARQSNRKQAEKYRARIAELRQLIQYLQGG